MSLAIKYNIVLRTPGEKVPTVVPPWGFPHARTTDHHDPWWFGRAFFFSHFLIAEGGNIRGGARRIIMMYDVCCMLYLIVLGFPYITTLLYQSP